MVLGSDTLDDDPHDKTDDDRGLLFARKEISGVRTFCLLVNE